MAKQPKKRVRERDLGPDEMAKRYADAVTPSKRRIEGFVSTVSAPGFFDGPAVRGDHIVAEHAGKDDAYLIDRALEITSRRVASTFPSARFARSALKLALSQNAELVCKWLADQYTDGTTRVRALLSDETVDRLAAHGASMVSIRHDDDTGLYEKRRCSAIEIVLRKVPKVERDDLGFQVVTCYPELEPGRDVPIPQRTESYEIDDGNARLHEPEIPSPALVPYGVVAATQAYANAPAPKRERIAAAYRADASRRALDDAAVPWFLDPRVDERGRLLLDDAATDFSARLLPDPDARTNPTARCIIELSAHGRAVGRTTCPAAEMVNIIEKIVERDRTLRDGKLRSDFEREARVFEWDAMAESSSSDREFG